MLVLTAAVAMGAVYTPSQVPNVQLKDSTQLVSNPDGILSAGAVSAINAQLRDIRSKTSAEPAMVVIDDMADGYDVDNFATDLFQLWGLGKKDKDNGLLILVVKNAKKYAIRPGYGVEGILPDVLCARIGRNVLAPAFRKGDFDGGLLEASKQINTIMTDPDVRNELLSEDEGDKFGFWDFVEMYIIFSVIVALGFLLYYLLKLHELKGKSDYDKYMALRGVKAPAGWASVLALGMPLIVYIPLSRKLDKWRNGPHHCPNCNTLMTKMDEERDNDYLTPAQDAEERLGSVDYDVWVCPNCNEVDVLPYSNPDSTFVECDNCHARAARLVRDRTLVQPTTRQEGVGVREYECLNCHHRMNRPYKIARREDPATAAAAGIIIGSLMGGGRGGGGGIGGGGFGGGSTGGGGASGGW